MTEHRSIGELSAMDTNIPQGGLLRGRDRKNYRGRGKNAGGNQVEGELATWERFGLDINTEGRGRGGGVTGERFVGGRSRGAVSDRSSWLGGNNFQAFIKIIE